MPEERKETVSRAAKEGAAQVRGTDRGGRRVVTQPEGQRLTSSPEVPDAGTTKDTAKGRIRMVREAPRADTVRPARLRKSQGGFFRLKRGLHQHGGVTFHPGDILEADFDLVEKLGPEKFERLSDRRGRFRSQFQEDVELEGEGTERDYSVKANIGEDYHEHQGPDDKAMREAGFDPTKHEDIAAFREAMSEQQEDNEREEFDTDSNVSEDEPESEDDGLDALTLSDLRSIAERESVDLTGATKKADVVERIRQSRSEE